MLKNRYNRILGWLFTAGPKLATAAVFAALFFGVSETTPVPRTSSLRRIVSLSPAISRQIRDLGEEERIVGVTSWDDLANKKGMTVTGNLIQINMETLVALRPDMVYSSREDSAVQRMEKISHLGLPAHTFTRNYTYEDIEENYLSLARMLGREERARHRLRACRRELKKTAAPAIPPVIAFFVSHDPLIPVTRVSHMHSIIEDAGGKNAFGGLDMPYPVISAEALVRVDPDIIITMAHGGGNALEGLTGKVTSVRAIRQGRVFYVPYDSFCSYTPADYVDSVKKLSGIIKQAAGYGP